MTRRKSVQELVRPLRKLSLLGGADRRFAFPPFSGQKTLIQTSGPTSPHHDLAEEVSVSISMDDHEQHDIITRLPREIALYIFGMLSFSDLVRVQLVSNKFGASVNSLKKTHESILLLDMPNLATNCTGRVDLEKPLFEPVSPLSRPLLSQAAGSAARREHVVAYQVLPGANLC